MSPPRLPQTARPQSPEAHRPAAQGGRKPMPDARAQDRVEACLSLSFLLRYCHTTHFLTLTSVVYSSSLKSWFSLWKERKCRTLCSRLVKEVTGTLIHFVASSLCILQQFMVKRLLLFAGRTSAPTTCLPTRRLHCFPFPALSRQLAALLTSQDSTNWHRC